jgi:DNA-directed RNA polymerase subunit omega
VPNPTLFKRSIDKPTDSLQDDHPTFPVGLFFAFMTSSFIDEALKVIPNQQLLVNVVSRRVRQLTSGHRPLVETGPRMGFSDIALKEIIEGKINYELTPVIVEESEI